MSGPEEGTTPRVEVPAKLSRYVIMCEFDPLKRRMTIEEGLESPFASKVAGVIDTYKQLTEQYGLATEAAVEISLKPVALKDDQGNFVRQEEVPQGQEVPATPSPIKTAFEDKPEPAVEASQPDPKAPVHQAWNLAQ